MEKVSITSDDGYTISPKSGRLKKKMKYRWKNDMPFWSRRRWRKIGKYSFYLFVIVGVFIAILFMFPEIRKEVSKRSEKLQEWKAEEDD